MEKRRFSLTGRIRSIGYAMNGLRILFAEEHNSRIQLLAAVVVVVLGFVYRISIPEWLAVALSIGFVLAMETMNSAIENMADFVSPGKHEMINPNHSFERIK